MANTHKPMSAESIALIAETEEKHTQELPQAQCVLVMANTSDGQFQASTSVSGHEYVGVGTSKEQAYDFLLDMCERAGFDPQFTALRDESVTISPAPTSQPVNLLVPATQPDAQPGEHEDPSFGLVVGIPTMDQGWVTPMSDPAAYKRMYLAAWEMATGFSVYAFGNLAKQGDVAMNIRSSVTALMESGEAGTRAGVVGKAKGPWAMGVGVRMGVTTDMLWVRTLGLPDPTTAPFRAGMGAAREAHLKNLSGLPVHPDKVEQSEAAKARKWGGVRGQNNSAVTKERRAAKQAKAHAAGMAAKEAAQLAGHSESIQQVHYMWIYCATMRAQGEVHMEYERQLTAAGITKEQLNSVVEQLVAQSKAA